jgi:Ribbon-helix-helix protein, copG family
MKPKNQLERLTVLVGRDDITRIKHLAAKRRESTSQIVRAAMTSWLTAREQSSQNAKTLLDRTHNAQEP